MVEKKFKIEFIEDLRSGSSPQKQLARVFLEDLKRKNLQEYLKVIHLLDRWQKNNEPCKKPERFKPQEDGIYAIKSNYVRLYCFYFDDGENQILYMTNGYLKKKNKAKPEELEKAKAIRNAFLEANDE